MLNLRTGEHFRDGTKTMTRRDALKGLTGIGVILASGSAPAILRHDLEMRTVAMTGGGVTAKDYVQDGLLALWDGIENNGWGKHKTGSGKWKDLVNGFELSAYSTSSSYPNLVYYDDYVWGYDGIQNFYGLRWRYSTQVTMEVARSGGLWASAGDGSPLWRHEQGASTLLLNGTSFTASASVINSANTITATIDNGVGTWSFNGVLKYTVSCSTTMGTNFTPLRRYENRNQNAHCARFYNRVLSASEIAHNYAIDKVRFGFPR